MSQPANPARFVPNIDLAAQRRKVSSSAVSGSNDSNASLAGRPATGMSMPSFGGLLGNNLTLPSVSASAPANSRSQPSGMDVDTSTASAASSVVPPSSSSSSSSASAAGAVPSSLEAFDALNATTQPAEAASSSTPATAATTTTIQQHPSGIVPQLLNIVSTVNLGVKLDLKKIALHARNSEYNPRRFAAVIMRLREPKTTALIFSSGKVVVTGGRSRDESLKAGRMYARIVQKLGFPVVFTDFKVQNIVGVCDVKFPIKLESLAYAHNVYSSYEPELFPGLIYRMVSPKITLLIFVSGKVVLTGAKSQQEIYKAFENIYPVLFQFKKT